MERDVVGDPTPQLAVESEIKGCDDSDTALRLRPAQKGDIHVGTPIHNGGAAWGRGKPRPGYWLSQMPSLTKVVPVPSVVNPRHANQTAIRFGTVSPS
ncbi:hypothetical protein GCM10022227_30310 [Streptomyces sedi]